MTTMTRTLMMNGNFWQWNDAKTGSLYTSEDLESHEEKITWICIENEWIVDLGPSPAPAELQATCDTIIDLQEQLVLPGLQDSHIHIYLMGEAAEYLSLHGCQSISEMQQRIVEYGRNNPEKEWIVGFGWEQDALNQDGSYPTRLDLDQVMSDRPILLWRVCWHIAIVNTCALKKAGIDHPSERRDWPIDGGVIDMDPDMGMTGIFRETAVNIIQKHIHEGSADIRKRYLTTGLQTCLEYGLTGVQTNDSNVWTLYQELQELDQLPLRVYVTPEQSEILGHGESSSMPLPGTQDRMLNCHRVKLFADGSLGAETAALREPYRDTGTNVGLLIETNDELMKKIQVATEAGYRVEIHAIGDRAAAQVLSVMELYNNREHTNICRPILNHCQILGPDLLPKIAALEMVCNIQPSFVPTDAAFVQKRIADPVALEYSYCWKSMLDAGLICAGGSDAPIETSNPLQGMFDAIYREYLEDTPDNNKSSKKTEKLVYGPQERLTFGQALGLYTLGATYAAGKEGVLGEIQRGFLADLTIVNCNVAQDPRQLLTAFPTQVWVHGQLKFQQTSPKGQSTTGASKSLAFPGKNGKIRTCACCTR